MTKNKNFCSDLGIYIIISNIFILDRIIKIFFIKNPSLSKDFLFLNFGLEKNTGIAFGIPFNKPLLILIGIIFSIIMMILLARAKEKILAIILFLFLMGALSNLLDRLIYEAVIDYIALPHLFVFNIADVLISGGFLLTMFYVFLGEKT